MAQADFLDELAVLEAYVEWGEAMLYCADAAHPTHNTRAIRAWCAVGKERPLLTVSGRERVNLNAALNAYGPTQVLLDETRCVNAQSTRCLSEQLLATHPDKARIYVVYESMTTPAPIKTRSYGPGWPISLFARCFCRLTRPS